MSNGFDLSESMNSLNEVAIKMDRDFEAQQKRKQKVEDAAINTANELQELRAMMEAERSERIKAEAKNDNRFSSQMIVAVIAAVAAVAAVIVPIALAFWA